MSALLRQSGLGGACGGTAGDRDAGYRAWCCAGHQLMKNDGEGDTGTVTSPSPHQDTAAQKA